MGVVNNIGFDKYPEQASFLNLRVKVCFNYEHWRGIEGTCIRDDLEEPFQTIFRLDDGRIILSTECQYTPV